MAGKRRTIKDLQEARILDQPPPFLAAVNKNHRKGSANWAGVNYENKFADYMLACYGDKVLHGPWIEFTDAHGTSICQPDLVLLPEEDRPLMLFECKLTFRARAATTKMINMYGPCAEKIWGQKPLLVQVCKFLRPYAKHTLVVKQLDELLGLELKSTDETGPITWCWRPL